MRKPKRTKQTSKSDIEIEYLGVADDLSDEEIERAEQAIGLADEEDQNCRVNFRWNKHQLELVKAVADHIGVPYQAYIKQVLAERAAVDYEKIQARKHHVAENSAPYKAQTPRRGKKQ